MAMLDPSLQTIPVFPHRPPSPPQRHVSSTIANIQSPGVAVSRIADDMSIAQTMGDIQFDRSSARSVCADSTYMLGNLSTNAPAVEGDTSGEPCLILDYVTCRNFSLS